MPVSNPGPNQAPIQVSIPGITRHKGTSTMHIKRRGTRAMLYRSRWIPKGANGNSHGYSQQIFVGSISADSGGEALSAELMEKLTPEELQFLEEKLFQPARRAAEQRQKAAKEREADPVWRLAEAARLAHEAAHRSEGGAVPNSNVAAVQAALSKVRTIHQTPAHAPPAENSKSDPLKDALLAIQAARDAVLAGRYGTAPAEGVRSTYPYKLWADIFEAVGGSDGNSLMRALQAKGFAKTRGK